MGPAMAVAGPHPVRGRLRRLRPAWAIQRQPFHPCPIRLDQLRTNLQEGALGEWDYLLWGAFTGAAVRKEGTYYLYYQGARGYPNSFDETVS